MFGRWSREALSGVSKWHREGKEASKESRLPLWLVGLNPTGTACIGQVSVVPWGVRKQVFLHQFLLAIAGGATQRISPPWYLSPPDRAHSQQKEAMHAECRQRWVLRAPTASAALNFCFSCLHSPSWGWAEQLGRKTRGCYKDHGNFQRGENAEWFCFKSGNFTLGWVMFPAKMKWAT